MILGIVAVAGLAVYTLGVIWSVWFITQRSFRQGIWAAYGKVEPPKKPVDNSPPPSRLTILGTAKQARERIKHEGRRNRED